jgi:formate-dependent nitrite reductase cytochrome c552 subunit
MPRTFVGSSKCADCHESAYDAWKKSRHAHATETLTNPPERGDIGPRHYDPECISCHVTGWEPAKYLPYQSGFTSIETTDAVKASPQLHHVGCESCHGPGSAHVAAEEGEIEVDEKVASRLQLEMRQTLADAETGGCLKCHDLDNSPDFHKPGMFEKYWKKIEH